jgi:hypothetical protein
MMILYVLRLELDNSDTCELLLDKLNLPCRLMRRRKCAGNLGFYDSLSKKEFHVSFCICGCCIENARLWLQSE